MPAGAEAPSTGREHDKTGSEGEVEGTVGVMRVLE